MREDLLKELELEYDQVRFANERERLYPNVWSCLVIFQKSPFSALSAPNRVTIA